jgi:hypothetical protein
MGMVNIVDEESLFEIEAGEKVGRDPRTLTPGDLAMAGIEPSPVLDAIRAKCVDCSGGSRSEVAKCVSVYCALWPFRMGTNPFRTKRTDEELSDAQRTAREAFAMRARERASKKHED